MDIRFLKSSTILALGFVIVGLPGCYTPSSQYVYQRPVITVVNPNPEPLEVIPGSGVFLFPVLDEISAEYTNVETGKTERASTKFPEHDLETGSYEIKYDYKTELGTEIPDYKVEWLQSKLQKLQDYLTLTPELIALLVDMDIEYDEVEEIAKIVPATPTLDDPPITIHIALDKKGNTLSRIQFWYQGSEWLFAKSVKLAMDDVRWETPRLSFNRDNTARSIWEWSFISLNDVPLNVIDKIVTSEKVIVRFNGQQYYDDKWMSKYHQELFKKGLEISRILDQK